MIQAYVFKASALVLGDNIWTGCKRTVAEVRSCHTSDSRYMLGSSVEHLVPVSCGASGT